MAPANAAGWRTIMTITLDLKPEIEERLRENASGAGLSVEEYLLRIAEQEAATSLELNSSASKPPRDSNGTAVGQANRIDPAALDRLRLSTEPGAYPPGSLAEMFAQWQAEDATDDPEELARRDRELEELKANLNANRAACGDEPLFP
ncbi:MAG TPA: hypothetical protein VFJ58_23765 [Armatimonadota bacterium]|nr:hypothetical protein [Armatimonadota bacterium]